MNKLTNNSTKH